MAWQSWRCTVCQAKARLRWDWSASRGLSCRGHVRCDKEWIGSRGELQYVAVNRGMVGHVKAVMSSQGAARCASDWRVLAVWLSRV